jgi:ATP-dependent Lon protease
LYTVGTRAVIRRQQRQTDHIDIMVLGVERVVVVKVDEGGPFLTGRVRSLPLPDDSSRETEAMTLSIVELASKYVGLTQGQMAPSDVSKMFGSQHDPLALAFMVASIMNLDVAKEQGLLETPTRLDGLRMIHAWLSHEVDVLELRNKNTDTARSEISREQKEYVLRQQKRAIEQELGEKNPDQAEVENLRERLTTAELPEDSRKEAER